MKIHLMPQFLEDLRTMDDSRFVKRVIGQILDGGGNFRRGQEDHRFDGIQDAWIRYISAGKSAYRLIYILKDEDVYLYRTGQHSIEDNLAQPRRFAESIEVSPVEVQCNTRSQTLYDDGILLKTSQPVFLRKIFTSLMHVGHKEIYLVSPFVSESLLDRFAPFGRFLDKMIEEKTQIILVTLPPDQDRLNVFQALEERGISVYFYKNLHAKLYLFEIDSVTLNQYTRDVADTAILGSANLTDTGFSLKGEGGNEELCYRLPATKYSEAKDYVTWLVVHSEDFVTRKYKALRRF